MIFNALITLDLPSVSSETRAKFYDILKNKKWEQIDSLTTSWTYSFPSILEHYRALDVLLDHLQDAKNATMILRVEYAVQLGYSNVEIGNL